MKNETGDFSLFLFSNLEGKKCTLLESKMENLMSGDDLYLESTTNYHTSERGGGKKGEGTTHVVSPLPISNKRPVVVTRTSSTEESTLAVNERTVVTGHTIASRHRGRTPS